MSPGEVLSNLKTRSRIRFHSQFPRNVRRTPRGPQEPARAVGGRVCTCASEGSHSPPARAQCSGMPLAQTTSRCSPKLGHWGGLCAGLPGSAPWKDRPCGGRPVLPAPPSRQPGRPAGNLLDREEEPEGGKSVRTSRALGRGDQGPEPAVAPGRTGQPPGLGAPPPRKGQSTQGGLTQGGSVLPVPVPPCARAAVLPAGPRERADT